MISVCIATYNGEKYIKEQLDSILCQIGDDDEIIISDDGSTDGTISIIRKLNDNRITILHSTAHNIIRNFENALKHAKGNYIFLADQDDVWLPDKYEKCLSLLKDYDLVVSDAIVTDEKLNTIKKSFFYHFNCGKGIMKNAIRSTYFGACMAFNRKTLNYALPFPNDKEIGHDLWIGFVAEITGKVLFFPEALILYRRHKNAFTNISTKIDRSDRSLFQKISGRIIMLKHIVACYLKYKFSCKKV